MTLIGNPAPQQPWESFEDAVRAVREKLRFTKEKPGFGADRWVAR
jgi:hypothetical protein